MAKHTIELTDDNFSEKVYNSDKHVLVDFWAQWCGPCLQIAPYLEELAAEYEGKIVVGKLDVDTNAQTSAKYGIRSIPTLILFKGDQIIEKQIGGGSKADLKRKFFEGKTV